MYPATAKKKSETRRCTCYKADLKYYIHCHSADCDCKNLKPLSEHIVEMDCGGQRAPSIRRLFNDTRAIPAVLEFLEKTKVGQMPSKLLMEAGQDDEEAEEIELWPQEEEEGSEISDESEEEDGPGPPS